MDTNMYSQTFLSNILILNNEDVFFLKVKTQSINFYSETLIIKLISFAHSFHDANIFAIIG